MRDAIYAFLEAVQLAEQFADPANKGRSVLTGLDYQSAKEFLSAEDARVTERNTILHRMWFRQKALEVIATDELKTSSYGYTVIMRDVLFGKIPNDTDMWKYMDAAKVEFLKLARVALYDNPPRIGNA